MACNHLLADFFPYGAGSVAKWAINPDRRLVVFVHGFGGHALATWSDFPKIVEQPPFDGADVVFYGYESRSTRADFSAGLLRSMIEFLDRSSPALINQTTGIDLRPPTFCYESIIIVAHSLGAALARRVVVDLCRTRSPSFNKVRLALFAPAHTGGDIVKIAVSALAPTVSGGLLCGLARVVWPVLNDLEPGCSFLADLARDTSYELASTPSEPLIATSIVTGSRDHVVNPARFCSDLPPHIAGGQDHISVCKPHDQYEFPVQTVAGLL